MIAESGIDVMLSGSPKAVQFIIDEHGLTGRLHQKLFPQCGF
jgi:hypothetical protein